ncbi:MAG TPA: class I SAM-dependent methyltransferase, partial [Beijerinckiaceae bacterium]|nr:class I SAM-dependent methyltransferase [Beijerinckiaceae bacterium]
MHALDFMRWAERRIGTRRAAPYYYSAIFRLAPRYGLSCFNFGYADAHEAVDHPGSSEPYQLELYRQTALAIGADRLRDACLLEISSGLGGGLAYIHRVFKPRLSIGLERALSAVLSSRRRFGLITVQGDAVDLRLPNAAFDVVINVEASHVYFDDVFVGEVARVMRPGGAVAITDSRLLSPSESKKMLETSFERCGLSLVSFREITSNVAKACELDDPRRERVLAKLPFFLRPAIRTMLGGITTPNFVNLRDNRSTYFIAVGMKPL